MTLDDIRADIAAACAAAGRQDGDVRLVAVTKGQSADDIRPLLEAGHRIFGENRVQEAAQKWPALRADYPDIELHFIGHLQTNKVREAVALFDVIETVDRDALAEALDAEMRRQGRRLPCLVQVNTGEEPQKGGVAPQDIGGLLAFCRGKTALDIKGLMCIPPEDELPDMHFALLHACAGRETLPLLSMGMSGDFQTAIRYGATHIRIGRALFGPREI